MSTQQGMKYLSKSDFIRGCQCLKLAWHSVNSDLPPPDAQALAAMEEGRRVGQMAWQLFPGGVEIRASSFAEAVSNSALAVQRRCPVYEASLAYNECTARADILVPASDNSWDLIEVKSTTSVEDVHLNDIAFQSYVMAGAGLRIRRYVLAHINRNFVKSGVIDPRRFFLLEDVTERVLALMRDVENNVNKISHALWQPRCSEARIGQHCSDPRDCCLRDQCWSFLPPGSVVELHRSRNKFDLLTRGITRIADIPETVKLTPRQTIQRRVARTGRPHVDHAAIQAFLGQIKYPVSSLDFETWSTPIPLLDGTKPYQQICFENSLHILRSPDALLEHHIYLADSVDDPRPAFMRSLRGVLPPEGSVLGYNISFELARLKECSEASPEFRPWVDDIQRRALDLLPVFRQFAFYDARQHGSCSLKAILRPLTGKTYDDLDVRNGTMASAEFLRVMIGDVDDVERQQVRRALEMYCSRDTESLLWIIRALCKLVETPRS